MYLIPIDAYQHWPIAWLGTQVLVFPLTALGVENTGYPSELGYAELQFHGLLTNDAIDHFSVPKFWKGDPQHEATIKEIEFNN